MRDRAADTIPLSLPSSRSGDRSCLLRRPGSLDSWERGPQDEPLCALCWRCRQWALGAARIEQIPHSFATNPHLPVVSSAGRRKRTLTLPGLAQESVKRGPAQCCTLPGVVVSVTASGRPDRPLARVKSPFCTPSALFSASHLRPLHDTARRVPLQRRLSAPCAEMRGLGGAT